MSMARDVNSILCAGLGYDTWASSLDDAWVCYKARSRLCKIPACVSSGNMIMPMISQPSMTRPPPDGGLVGYKLDLGPFSNNDWRVFAAVSLILQWSLGALDLDAVIVMDGIGSIESRTSNGNGLRLDQPWELSLPR